MAQKDPETLEIRPSELLQLLERVQGVLPSSDYEVLALLVKTFLELIQVLENKKASIARLRSILFGAKTEKTRNAAGKDRDGGGKARRKKKKKKKKRKGHGRNGVDAYPDAKKIPVAHETLKAKQICPGCSKGKLHCLPSGKELRIKGQPLLEATVYEQERLRCALCGLVFTAKLPKEAGTKKYDEAAGGIIAMLKYGMGLPFYRLEKFQDALNVPVPASVQWEIVEEMARRFDPAFRELIRQAAQAQVLYNDDTGMKVLDLAAKANGEDATEESTGGTNDKKRKGMYTSAIVATDPGYKIALYFTGHQYAGENLKDVLAHRAEELPAPIQMCDALLSRNLPGDLETIVANCIAHARRRFFEVEPQFPDECQHVLEELAQVYGVDELAKKSGLTAEERLELHQKESGPVMERLQTWLQAQLDEKKVEPNSGLGKAIKYFLNHWERMTLFLRKPGAPLDNNICERAIKIAILHRKNSYFYKTKRGAAVGDLFMSFIQTCRLNEVNPFECFIELQKNEAKMREKPWEWMPWNYKATLARGSPPG